MGERLYNGVSLPALPEWDKGAFPYAYIARNIGVTAYILTVAAERPVYGPDPLDGSVNSVYHYGRSASYLVHEGAWLLMEEEDELVHIREDVGKVIWTNTDILRPDGSIYLAAESSEVDGFLLGLALGLCGKPLPIYERIPVAYLYNGMRLPKLPEWDKKKYPFAVIIKGTSIVGAYTELMVYEKIAYRTTEDGRYQVGYMGAYERSLYSSVYDEWNDFAYGNTGEDARFLCDVGSDYIHWTNTDIYYQSGEVAYPAIAPVPVYE